MRNYFIDNIRSIAVILMLIHHYFYFHPFKKVSDKIEIIGKISRYIFLLLVGINLKINSNSNKLKNQLKILFCAILVSITSYLFLSREQFIFFGILHFIFFISLFFKLFIKKNLDSILLIILSLFFFNLVKNKSSDNYLYLILGSNSINLYPIDHFSILYWIYIVCLGYLIGDLFKFLNLKNIYIGNLGKNSLLIYILHILPLIFFYKYKFKI